MLVQHLPLFMKEKGEGIMGCLSSNLHKNSVNKEIKSKIISHYFLIFAVEGFICILFSMYTFRIYILLYDIYLLKGNNQRMETIDSWFFPSFAMYLGKYS